MNQSSNLIVSRTRAGKNPCYLLSGNEAFSSTRYKMMQGMLESGLLPCVVYHYNGKPKLMYMAGDSKPLSELGILDEETLLRLVGALLSAAEQLCAPGFLNLDNVESDMNLIFANTQASECSFVFLPLNNGGEGNGDERFQAGVFSAIRALIMDHSKVTSGFLRSLIDECASPDASFSRMRRMLQMVGGHAKDEVRGAHENGLATGQQLRLVGVDTPVNVDILINKPDFVIGKSVNGVDGTISCNAAISRIHCKIIQNGMKSYISDLGSSNGTFVNGQRLQGGQALLIQVGDRIRLANSTFELRGS